ncbi:MAG: tRNA lysidine(34) synthetase TilS [Clostridia bacterium]|nr:tRNA lysidine(34) synthetase TilS [Clostridia bacterium]
MRNKLEGLFSSERGARIYSEGERAINDFEMRELLSGGVLVGLSGGADSVMLLLFLIEYRRVLRAEFPILAVHVNHMIRGGEADRDEEFSRELCESLGVEFISRRIDVPALSKESGTSLEETARNVRYSVFTDIIDGRNDISVICVAHNADDNFETVLINMMRGAGTRGVSGISARRDNVIRPLIYVSKADITAALTEENIPFVTDSTNESDDYTRNYIRHNVIPRLTDTFATAYTSLERMCRNLREDDDCLNLYALEFARAHKNGAVLRRELAALPKAILFRALKLYFNEVSSATLSEVHVRAIKERLASDGDFSLSMPSGVNFVARGEFCGFEPGGSRGETGDFNYKLDSEITHIADFNAKIVISRAPLDDNFSNVYNISTQVNLGSAIIKGGLYVRNKRDGDTCRWGGITRRLKKLFNDKKIPTDVRGRIPVLCDECGVVWVPGFGVRDDGGKQDLYIKISTNSNAAQSFYLPQRFMSKNKKKG